MYKYKLKSLIPELWSDISGYPKNVVSVHRIIWILRFYGVPIPTDCFNGYTKIIYSIYSIFTMICVVTFYVTCELSDAYYVTISGDIEDIIHNYSITFCTVTTMVKVFNLLWYWNKICDFVNLLNYSTQKYGNTEQHIKTLQKLDRIVSATYYMYILSSWITISLGYIMIIKDPTTMGTKLPFRAKIPNFMPNVLSYPIHVIGLFWLAQINITHNCLIMALMNQIVGQLMILDYNLRSLISTTTEEIQHNNDVMVIKKLKSYIKHHQIILKLNNDLELAFSRIFLMQFFISLLLFGFCGFLVSYKRNFSTSQLAICTYGVGVLLELYVWCYFGNQIIYQSKAITTSAYSCSWYAFNRKFNVLLIILMSKSQDFLKLTGENMFVMSLDTYAYVLTRSYSYIAVLQRFYNGK